MQCDSKIRRMPRSENQRDATRTKDAKARTKARKRSRIVTMNAKRGS